MRAGIVTISDRAASGEKEDLSGKVVAGLLANIGATVEIQEVVPEDLETIVETLVELTDEARLDLIVTTGGTGVGPRDVTPEATLRVVHRLVPGIPERMRYEGMSHTPHAMLSRAAAGVRHSTLIINLPGSPQAAKECFAAVGTAIYHAVELLQSRSRSE